MKVQYKVFLFFFCVMVNSQPSFATQPLPQNYSIILSGLNQLYEISAQKEGVIYNFVKKPTGQDYVFANPYKLSKVDNNSFVYYESNTFKRSGIHLFNLQTKSAKQLVPDGFCSIYLEGSKKILFNKSERVNSKDKSYQAYLYMTDLQGSFQKRMFEVATLSDCPIKISQDEALVYLPYPKDMALVNIKKNTITPWSPQECHPKFAIKDRQFLCIEGEKYFITDLNYQKKKRIYLNQFNYAKFPLAYLEQINSLVIYERREVFFWKNDVTLLNLDTMKITLLKKDFVPTSVIEIIK